MLAGAVGELQAIVISIARKNVRIVLGAGLEPARLSTQDPKSCASTSSAIRAHHKIQRSRRREVPGPFFAESRAISRRSLDSPPAWHRSLAVAEASKRAT